MDIQLLKDTKDGKRLFALVLLIFGIGIFISLFGVLLGAGFIEGPIFERISSMGNLNTPSDVSLMKYFQIISQFAFFIIPALTFGFLIDKKIWGFFKLNSWPSIIMLGLGILTLLMSNPLSEWLIYQNGKMSLPSSLSAIEQWMREAEERAAFATNVFLDMKDWKDYAINILMIGVLAGIGEELLLRGALQPIFIRMFKNEHIGIWFTAIIFSMIHFQFYGFFARMFLGALLGYFYYYSKNLWVPIIAHFFNNSMAVTYVYITKEPLFSTQPELIEQNEPQTLWALLSLSLVILGVFLMKYYRNKVSIE